MKRIIIPLDSSGLDDHAVGLGERMAAAFGGAIELVHVRPATPVPAGRTPDPVSMDRHLGRVAARLSSRFSVETAVLEGDPCEELLARIARTRDVIVVMASHGQRGLRRLAFGSMADRLVREGSVPVAVIRGAAGTPDRAPRHLLLALDGSELAEQALPPAMRIAETFGATIHLVRVVNASFSPYLGASYDLSPAEPALLAEIADQMHEDARRYLNDAAVAMRQRGIRVSWEVRAGSPGEEIVRAAETTGADFIVMCSHGRGGIRRLVLGSVTDKVLRTGTTPLLVIPASATERMN